jgi:Nuclease-related domain
MLVVNSDPVGRTAGQYARAAVRRLRMRTLVSLGVLAVASALLGRTFGLHDKRFLASEVALLVSMFVISRYVMPLVERRDRGASGEEHVGSLLEQISDDGWRVIHDASLGRGNVDHILIGPPGVLTVETKSHPGPVRVSRLHGATLR